MDYLFVESSDGQCTRQELDGDRIRVGRGRINDLRLEDPHVSRLHAEIVRRSDGIYIRDIGAKGGTFINDDLLTGSKRLEIGDCIRMGKTRIIFNASAPSKVQFSDKPLPPDLDTTSIPVRSIPTPPPQFLMDTPFPPSGSSPGVVARKKPPPGDISPTHPLLDTFPPEIVRVILETDRHLVFKRRLDEILNQMMDLVRDVVGFERGVLMLLKKGELVAQVASVLSDRPTEVPLTISRTIADRVLRNLEAVLCQDALADERFRKGESIQAEHIRSAMCVPLWTQDEVIGLIYVDNRTLAGQFTQRDLLILTHMAYIVSGKIEQQKLFEEAIAARAMEKDLKRAAEIQKTLLPADPPDIPGYRLHGSSTPCFAVGGDYFDYIELTGGRWGIGVGDVAGKGLPAAMLMCSFQASLHALSTLDLPPDETITRLNGLLHPKFPANRFVTFFYGVLDPATHTLTYVNAAHNPPLLLPVSGNPYRLETTSGPIGPFEDARFTAKTVRLEQGDTLVCYSDGATEARNPEGEFFSTVRFTEFAMDKCHLMPKDLVENIENNIDDFLCGMPHQDDLTLLVLRRDR